MPPLYNIIVELPDDTIVFLFIFSRDQGSQVFSHELRLRALAEHCDVPMTACGSSTSAMALWTAY
jgi:hypothetical protein